MRSIPGFRFNSRKGKAYCEVTVPKTGGRVRRRKTIEVGTMEEALSEWKKFRDDVLAGRGARPLTFRAYAKRFWPSIAKRLAAKTAKDETFIVKKSLVPFFGDYELRKLNAALVRDFVVDLKAKELSASTINGRIAVLRQILNDAVEREVIAASPVQKYPHERVEPLRLELSDEEQARFLGAFDDREGFRKAVLEKVVGFGNVSSSDENHAAETAALDFHFERFRASKPLFVVALETGLRRGDLLGLTWSNVKNDQIELLMRKTRRFVEIPMSSACRTTLEECRSRSLVGRHVFLTESGQPYPVTTIRRYFDLAKRIAGIKRRFRFHDLRHTFGSTLASRGVPIQIISKVMGHSSVRVTERYARPSEDAIQMIVDALESSGTPRPQPSTVKTSSTAIHRHNIEGTS